MHINIQTAACVILTFFRSRMLYQGRLLLLFMSIVMAIISQMQ